METVKWILLAIFVIIMLLLVQYYFHVNSKKEQQKPKKDYKPFKSRSIVQAQNNKRYTFIRNRGRHHIIYDHVLEMYIRKPGNVKLIENEENNHVTT